jgi:cation-transporting ATPase 13A1
MEGAAKMRAELKHSLADIYDESRPVDKVGWFDWMNMDIEEHAERKKREKEKSVLDALPKDMRVPGRYTPTFWSMLVTGVIATLHALVLLLQHWIVGFNMSLNYVAVDTSSMNLPDDEEYESWSETGGSDDSPGDLSEIGVSGGNALKPGSWKLHPSELSHAQVVARGLPTQARIRPAKGRDILVPVSYLPTMGATFEYHRRRFVWDSSRVIWLKVRCQTKMPLKFFSTWTGYEKATHLRAAYLRYGPNEFDVRQPTFQELYKAQLLSPFTVFQLFCVILWMLDEYWQYSAFTLFMILTFEATVVFSRIKSLGALKGMGNKSRNVFVFRNNRWTAVESCRLLPGDIFSLTRNKPRRVEGTAGGNMKSQVDNQDGDIVPADLLLMRGHTVVSEASLTGESVPQMKDGLAEIELGAILAMKSKDKNHVLYAGTKLLQCEGDAEKAGVLAIEEVEDEDADGEQTRVITVDKEESEVSSDENSTLSSKISTPPDHGCICFVLRTGFSSAQGKLVRMIEGSQEKVKGHEKETGLLLLLLFFFACASSGYVLKHGMENGNRSKYELLLHCILIITSVIPPELPMQMALAVNNSLMTLMKMQVFCTEPFRVPMAGKVDCCLFDKTGTLTTDELVAVGVYAEAGTIKKGQGHDRPPTPMTQVNNEAGLVIAGCHSLVFVDGSIVGDPLEDESLSSMRWAVSARSGRVKPALPTEKKSAGKPLNVDGQIVDALDILGRHHFSSKLQRMSCLVKDNKGRLFVVAKGSPEAIGALLESRPSGYEEESMRLAKNGYRVIALAYKSARAGSDEDSCLSSRSHCEQNLKFAGFIAFTCRVRELLYDALALCDICQLVFTLFANFLDF